MAAVSAIGFGLLIAGQLTAKRPVIKLSLLFDRQFGSVALMAMVLGVVLYGTAYVIPQFLSAIAGYNALQSGKIVLISGIPSLFMMAMVPILIRTVDIRLAVALGLAIMGSSSLLDAHLDMFSVGGDFVASQLLRGVRPDPGHAVPQPGGDPVRAARGCGRRHRGCSTRCEISAAAWRWPVFPSSRISASGFTPGGWRKPSTPIPIAVQARVTALTQSLGGEPQALRRLSQQIELQALVMTYNDIFWIMGVGTLVVMPFVLFLRPLPKSRPAAAMH